MMRSAFISVPGHDHCPTCGVPQTALVAASYGEPEPADLLVCLACGSVAVYTPERTLRPFDDADLYAYSTSELMNISQVIRELRQACERSV